MKPHQERLSRLDTSILSDALDKLGIDGVAIGLQPLGRSPGLCGRVVTVELRSRTTGAATAHRHLATAAVEAAEPGDIVVIDNEGRTDVAGWGGKLSQAAQGRGVAGVVIDGCTRDLRETLEAGLGVFARGAVPVSARGRVVETAWQVSVRVCGVRVDPGDWVRADETGVVFVPATRTEEVLETAERLARDEAAATERIRLGEPISEVMGRGYETALAADEPGPD